MISRRTIRIKVLQVLYSYFLSDEKSSLQKVEKELLHSLEKTYDLFFLILLLVSDLRDYAEKRIETRMNRLTASEADKNPNRKFINNKVIRAIAGNKHFKGYVNSRKLSWINYPELIRKLYQNMAASDAYKEYMNLDRDSVRTDKKFVKFIIGELFYNCEDFYQAIEEQSIYWNDDVDYLISLIITKLHIFKLRQKDREIPPLFKNKDDKLFAKTLLDKIILRNHEVQKLIAENISNWDIDRIVFIDRLIIGMAITELLEFPTIPPKVTFNEYIEISKRYGTPKSSSFINGALDKIVSRLEEENRIHKTGRGLIDK